MSAKQNVEGDRADARSAAGQGPKDRAPEIETGIDGAVDADEPSLQDWIEAEHSRPTLPEETADGLDDLDEEVRHQAEDLPLDTPGR